MTTLEETANTITNMNDLMTDDQLHALEAENIQLELEEQARTRLAAQHALIRRNTELKSQRAQALAKSERDQSSITPEPSHQTPIDSPDVKRRLHMTPITDGRIDHYKATIHPPMRRRTISFSALRDDDSSEEEMEVALNVKVPIPQPFYGRGVANCEPNPFADTNKRPDIEWFIDGRRIYFDIAVTHPLNSTIVKQAACKQLAAAKHMENIKKNKYDERCRNIGAQFTPIVIESFGGYGPQFSLFLERLSTIANKTLTLTDGEALINEMLDQIAFHIIGLNGLIMKKASSNGAD